MHANLAGFSINGLTRKVEMGNAIGVHVFEYQ